MMPDKIESLPAGRELDARIASILEPKPPAQNVKILRSMSREDWKYSYHYMNSTGGFWKVQIGFDAEENPEWEPAYEFSADIGAAWLVVEFLRTYCMMDFFVGYSDNQKGYVAIWRKKADVLAIETFSETAPLSICLAALLATIGDRQ